MKRESYTLLSEERRNTGKLFMSVVVLGSINMDLVVRTPRLPGAGETLTGYSFAAVPGGKGANQAVACARSGVHTRMIGHVGDERTAAQAAHLLITRGVGRVIVKMGSKGVYWNDSTAGRFEPAFRVKAVDTVAAGDAFNGALAAALSSGYDFPGAVRWGMAAGALSATKPGAQPSMPDRASIMAMLKQDRPEKDSGA